MFVCPSSQLWVVWRVDTQDEFEGKYREAR